ncbi:tyrosine protein kinase [Bacteroidia bacterium]|nr:tyrosine protein kinase [Bacteroidia bacterium]
MEQNNFQTENIVEDEMPLAEIFVHYLRYWKFFILSIVVCLGLGYAYLLYTTQVYKVVSKIEISDEKKGKSALDMTAAFSDLGLFTPKNNLDNEIEVINSQTLMKSVVDSLRIGVSYFVQGRIKNTEIYKHTPVYVTISNVEKTGSFTIDRVNENALLIHSDKEEFDRVVEIDTEVNSPWGLLVLSQNPFGTVDYPIEVVVGDPKILPEVTISPVNKLSSVVEISIMTSCPEKGQDIINTLVGLYNRNAINEKNYVANNTIEFIDERLLNIGQDLKEAEEEVEGYRQKKGITDLEAQGKILLASTNEYEKKITEAEIQLNILRSVKSFLWAPGNKGNIAPSNVGLTDQTILSLIHTYNTEVIEKNKATAGMKEGNPILVETENRIASIRENLLKGIDISETSLMSTISELKKQEAMFMGKTRGLSTQEKESRELYRTQNIKESLLTYLLQKREETGLSLVLATPNAKVIDMANYSSIPVKPKKAIILLAALILALIIPICVIYVKDLFDNKIHSKEDIVKILNAPYLGEIPLVKVEQPFPVLKVRSFIAEKFRTVASNLEFMIGNEKSKVITVTSYTSGEGKSFFSLNLAMSLATIGKKTILIDLDIRKSVLSKNIDPKVSKGSAVFLSDAKINIDEVIDKSGTYHKNLDIIPVKIFPPNPSELLASDRLDLLFRSVKDDYEYIIVDTAPVGLVADAFSVNQYSSATIFLTKEDYTYKQILQEIQELYRNNKLRKLGVVLNGATPVQKCGHGYGNYYIEND